MFGVGLVHCSVYGFSEFLKPSPSPPKGGLTLPNLFTLLLNFFQLSYSAETFGVQWDHHSVWGFIRIFEKRVPFPLNFSKVNFFYYEILIKVEIHFKF